MISSILGLQLVIHARALLNAAIQGSLYSTMASVGLLGQMNRSQRFVAYLGRSTNGATHGIGRISAILGVLVIIMAGLSIDMRAKRHQKLRSDLRNVEEKYVEYYRDLSNQAISLRDGFGNVDGATTPITFVTFKTCHGTYFRAHPGGEGATIDLQTAIGPWEKFTIVNQGGNVVALKTCHGTYVRAHPGGEGATIDLQTAIGPWEKFTME
jgi:hypothetical protein